VEITLGETIVGAKDCLDLGCRRRTSLGPRKNPSLKTRIAIPLFLAEIIEPVIPFLLLLSNGCEAVGIAVATISSSRRELNLPNRGATR
jgi:hypothetical protein